MLSADNLVSRNNRRPKAIASAVGISAARSERGGRPSGAIISTADPIGRPPSGVEVDEMCSVAHDQTTNVTSGTKITLVTLNSDAICPEGGRARCRRLPAPPCPANPRNNSPSGC